MRLIGMLEASKVWKGLCPTGAEISIPPLQAARKLIASGPAKPAPHSKQFNGLRLKLTQALCKVTCCKYASNLHLGLQVTCIAQQKTLSHTSNNSGTQSEIVLDVADKQ